MFDWRFFLKNVRLTCLTAPLRLVAKRCQASYALQLTLIDRQAVQVGPWTWQDQFWVFQAPTKTCPWLCSATASRNCLFLGSPWGKGLYNAGSVVAGPSILQRIRILIKCSSQIGIKRGRVEKRSKIWNIHGNLHQLCLPRSISADTLWLKMSGPQPKLFPMFTSNIQAWWNNTIQKP